MKDRQKYKQIVSVQIARMFLPLKTHTIIFIAVQYALRAVNHHSKNRNQNIRGGEKDK